MRQRPARLRTRQSVMKHQKIRHTPRRHGGTPARALWPGPGGSGPAGVGGGGGMTAPLLSVTRVVWERRTTREGRMCWVVLRAYARRAGERARCARGDLPGGDIVCERVRGSKADAPDPVRWRGLPSGATGGVCTHRGPPVSPLYRAEYIACAGCCGTSTRSLSPVSSSLDLSSLF
jgi:hypothetical protein